MNLKSEFLSWSEVRQIADQIREEKLTLSHEIPIAIEHIIEHKLNLSIEPIKDLKNRAGIEGVLLGDFNSIIIDYDLFTDERYYARYRFTLAHELAHYILHRKQLKRNKFQTEGEWLQKRINLNSDDLRWFERQANEFAGRFLVPPIVLAEMIDKDSKIIKESASNWCYDKTEPEFSSFLIEDFAERNCSKFEVSSEVLIRRIYQEGFQKHFVF